MAIIFCDPSASGDNDGTSWEDAYESLQVAGDASASTGNQVWVKARVIVLTAPLDVDNANDPDFYGGFATDLTGTNGSVAGRDLANDITTLDGGDTYRCVLTSGWEGTFDGFKLLDGYTQDTEGAGIYVTTTGTSAITISNCEFNGCDTPRQFSFPDGGAGLFFSSNSSCDVVVDSCLFTGCTSYNHGGALATSLTDDALASATISNCTFTGNTTTDGTGGAMLLTATTTTIENCKFINNTATISSAGHIFTYYGTDTDIINSVFSGGSSDAKGGAIYLGWNSTVTITNCTLADNDCSDASGGGAVFLEGSTETLVATNCIFWDNTANSVANQIDGTGTITVTYSDVDGTGTYTGTGNVNDDPLFVGTGDDPYDLSGSSEAVDSGNAGATDYPTTDILGRARCDDPDTTTTGTGTPAYSDMGAYELQVDPPAFFGSLLLMNN